MKLTYKKIKKKLFQKIRFEKIVYDYNQATDSFMWPCDVTLTSIKSQIVNKKYTQ